jgi:hypothetical protein
MVIRHGMSLALVGIGIGLAAAIALARVMKNPLFNASPTDPATFALITLSLTFVALIACHIPVRVATKVGGLMVFEN